MGHFWLQKVPLKNRLNLLKCALFHNFQQQRNDKRGNFIDFSIATF